MKSEETKAGAADSDMYEQYKATPLTECYPASQTASMLRKLETAADDLGVLLEGPVDIGLSPQERRAETLLREVYSFLIEIDQTSRQ